MNCPKCHSENLADSTAGTVRCNDCDFAFVPGGTAPRWRDAGVKKTGSSAPLIILVILLVCSAIALGFVSFFWAILVGIFGLLAGILYYLARIAAK